ELGLLTGTLGKIARDIALLMASEVGEVFEPGGPGRGGSSTMPQKRNPVISATVIAAATRAPGLVATLLAAMSQEHERGVGLWQAEWESLPALVCLAHGALSHMVTLIEGLEIDRARMRDNIDITEGLVLAEAVMMALAPHLGRNEAHARLEAACHRAIGEHRHLKEIVAEDTVITGILTSADLERLFDPRDYLGMTKSMIEKVLATYHRSREEDAP
ncbi:MAG TPA: lyase family protein, partial [Stellaceae bacterium]|nr:lyase family protein [Stellaceae bacterium]